MRTEFPVPPVTLRYLRFHFLIEESVRERNLLELGLAANILQNLSLRHIEDEQY